MPRYLLKHDIEIEILGSSTRIECWMGIETAAPVDLQAWSREGYDLVPADGMTAAELASAGVERFEFVEE